MDTKPTPPDYGPAQNPFVKQKVKVKPEEARAIRKKNINLLKGFDDIAKQLNRKLPVITKLLDSLRNRYPSDDELKDIIITFITRKGHRNVPFPPPAFSNARFALSWLAYNWDEIIRLYDYISIKLNGGTHNEPDGQDKKLTEDTLNVIIQAYKLPKSVPFFVSRDLLKNHPVQMQQYAVAFMTETCCMAFGLIYKDLVATRPDMLIEPEFEVDEADKIILSNSIQSYSAAMTNTGLIIPK